MYEGQHSQSLLDSRHVQLLWQMKRPNRDLVFLLMISCSPAGADEASFSSKAVIMVIVPLRYSSQEGWMGGYIILDKGWGTMRNVLTLQ